ncbi:MAG: hypothetical protein WC708_07750 [Lentisphaeria bacterium]
MSDAPSPPPAAPPASAPHGTLKPRPKTGRVILGVLGWLAALGLLFFALTQPAAWRAREARVRAALAAVRETDVNAVEAEVSAAREKRNATTRAVNAEIGARNQARQDWADYEGRSLRLKEELAQVEKDLAVAREELRQATQRNPAVRSLEIKVVALRQERNRLAADYRTRLGGLRQEFQERLQARQPERMRQFYGSRQNTPFGPAALFFAAEFYYEARRSVDASRLYKELLRKYPDCGYVTITRQRQAEIQERQPYEPKDEIGIYPYHALIMNNVEDTAPPAAGGDNHVDRAL